jgi:hypothetical protein
VGDDRREGAQGRADVRPDGEGRLPLEHRQQLQVFHRRDSAWTKEGGGKETGATLPFMTLPSLPLPVQWGAPSSFDLSVELHLPIQANLDIQH